MPTNQRIWVTGGSSGIGLALLNHYRQRGWTTVGTARRREAPDSATHWIPADLSVAAERASALDAVLNAVEWPDLVVLNAGLGHWAPVDATEPADAERIFALNYWAVVDLTTQLAQRAKGRPVHLVVVSSIAARFGQKKLATYSASKAAVALWAESLNEEWQGSPHRVQLVLPGVVSTDIMRHSIGRDGQPLGDRAGQHRGWSAERTAQAIARATTTPRFAHILADPGIRLALILHDLCPRIFYFLLRRRP